PLLVFTSPTSTAFDAPASIQFAVEALSPAAAIGKVEFLSNGSVVGSSASPPYQFTWSNVGPGYYTVTAIATDTNGFTRFASMPIVVNGGNTPPSVALTSPSDGQVFIA